MRENKEGIIRLEHITSTVMRDVLEFMEIGFVVVHSTNAQDLLKTADFLLLPELKTVARRSLMDNLTVSNCSLFIISLRNTDVTDFWSATSGNLFCQTS